MAFIYKGVTLPELEGQCHVCGKLIPTGMPASVHLHPGHPRSEFDAMGRPRVNALDTDPIPLTHDQLKLLEALVARAKCSER